MMILMLPYQAKRIKHHKLLLHLRKLIRDNTTSVAEN